MHALVNAFLRCLSFLVPPSWLSVRFCWWVGDECGEMPWPNPRARFKSRKPLTYQEVTTQEGSIPSVSAVPGCVSLAATSPTTPQGSPWGRNWGLWQAVERVIGAPLSIHRRWCQKRRGLCSPFPVDFDSSSNIITFQRSTATTEEDEKGRGENTFTFSSDMSAATEFPNPNPIESVSDSSADRAIDEVITVDQHLHEMGTQVTITVAIQAAEDEEPEEVSSNNIDFLGGSCSEDEIGRHDKSRLVQWSTWVKHFLLMSGLLGA